MTRTGGLDAPGGTELRLSLRNDAASLGAAQGRLASWLEDTALGARPRHRIELAFEELVMNIVMHAHPEAEQGRHEIEAVVALRPDGAELSVLDDGTPFDPRGKAGERLSGSIEDVRIGGLGLLLVQELSTYMDHDQTPDGRNRTRVGIALA
jgi:anti-sigma regulatory factor (Ser/Thr protein kinase)